MYNQPRKAKLTKALVFKTQQGLAGPAVQPGSQIIVRYDEHNGCYNARHTLEGGKVVYRKDIPLHAFEYVND